MPKDADFPDLNKGSWEKASDADAKYNCIAFAAGRTDVFWWPDNYPDPESDYWPHGLLREETIAAFVQLFESLRFQCCVDGNLAVGTNVERNPGGDRCRSPRHLCHHGRHGTVEVNSPGRGCRGGPGRREPRRI